MLRSVQSITRIARISAQRRVVARAISTVSINSQSTTYNRKSTPIMTTQTRNFASPASISGEVGDVIPFPLADIGEGITECEVLQWFVKPGDVVKQFDRICEVQSDKANVEITSRFDGTLEELMYNVGDMAIVGKPLVTIKLSTAVVTAGAKKAAPKADTPAAACPLASAGKSSTSAILDVPKNNNDVFASPVVRRLGRELNIELGRVKPTGHKGQITKDDLYAYKAQIDASPASAAAITPVVAAPVAPVAPVATPTPVAPVPTRGTGAAIADKEIVVAGIQKVMVKTMTAAAAIPTLGFADEICVDKLIKLRSSLTERAKAHGVKVSYFAFIIKALSLALTKYPSMNAHVNSDCSIITQKGAHNIGLAMDTPKGLLVPNIKNVQDKSILEIAAELNRLQALGLQGKLGPEDLRGGTITLSNIGTIGGTYCTPVLVVPEVAIAALGKFYTKAAFDKDGKVYPSSVFNIGWTADHRAVDGATVARFSNEMKDLIENPEAMILF